MRNERVSMICGWLTMICADGADDTEVGEDADDDDDTVDDCSAIEEDDLCGGAGKMSWGYWKIQDDQSIYRLVNKYSETDVQVMHGGDVNMT